jgi:pimeloyl-ACP methyl ester carboxylesterase
MEHAEVRGLKIAYQRAGNGPTLLLLHGIGSNARSWRHQLTGLSDEFTVVAWDAPGYGASSDPPPSMRMADYAGYLAGLLDHMDSSRVHLAGLSWGGVLALEFYRRYPDRVLTLVLADTFLGGAARSDEQRQENLRMRLRFAEMDPAAAARERAPSLLSPLAPPKLVAEVESIMAEFHPAGYRAAAIASSEADERDVLPMISVPTLVVCGDHDRVTRPAEVELIHKGIPGSRFVLIPRAGHVSNQEQPERFNEAVRQFLRAAVPAGRA